jgi:hypothetical protein
MISNEVRDARRPLFAQRRLVGMRFVQRRQIIQQCDQHMRANDTSFKRCRVHRELTEPTSREATRQLSATPFTVMPIRWIAAC